MWCSYISNITNITTNNMLNNESNSNNLIQQYFYFHKCDENHPKNRTILQQIHTKLNNNDVAYIGSFIKIMNSTATNRYKFKYGYITRESQNCWFVTSVVIKKQKIELTEESGAEQQSADFDVKSLMESYSNCLEIPITMSHVDLLAKSIGDVKYLVHLETNKVIKKHVQIGIVLPTLFDTINKTDNSSEDVAELLCTISGSSFNPYCTDIR